VGKGPPHRHCGNDAEAAKASLNKVTSLYDKAAKVNTIHRNKANRKKAGLTRIYRQAFG